ncbi:MAG: hypothetical protein IT522_13010 [Burkholderiales bacterium]|nr:hypothetical protein [Burkholderiales bacterium]
MLTLRSLNRWQAFLIHLGLSISIAAVVIVLVVIVWYPPPYFTAMGGALLLRLIIGVDVVVGPIVTLLIFDPRKPRLAVDLAIVATVQLAALVYGTLVMFEARPAWNVFVKDRFEVTAANHVDAASLARAAEPFHRVPLTGPRLAVGHAPSDPQEALRLSLSSMAGGPDVAAQPHLFVPYAQEAPVVAHAARPLQALSRQGRANAEVVGAFLAEHGAGRDLGYVPVRARSRDFSAIVDRRSGEIVGYLPLNPW